MKKYVTLVSIFSEEIEENKKKLCLLNNDLILSGADR